MEESLISDIGLDPCVKWGKSDTHDQRCRNLFAAIIYQAYRDAVVDSFISAINFFNPNDKLFCAYCRILDIDPEWVAKKVRKKIQNKSKDVKPSHAT